MTETLFGVEGLSKRFGAIQALSDVAFHVRVGELLGLIGPNGAGKSTLFECLAGVQPCDAGVVRGRNGAVAVSDRSALLFYLPDGMVPWESQPVGWALDYTVGFFGGRAALCASVVTELGLEELLRRPIRSLSKGQRKRALLAVGLLTPQPALLIDEPFDGLDLRQTREVASALRGHAKQGRTLFLSIHQIADAAALCGRYVLLSNGRVCGEGTLSELQALAGAGHDSLEEVFLALT